MPIHRWEFSLSCASLLLLFIWWLSGIHSFNIKGGSGGGWFYLYGDMIRIARSAKIWAESEVHETQAVCVGGWTRRRKFVPADSQQQHCHRNQLNCTQLLESPLHFPSVLALHLWYCCFWLAGWPVFRLEGPRHGL